MIEKLANNNGKATTTIDRSMNELADSSPFCSAKPDFRPIKFKIAKTLISHCCCYCCSITNVLSFLLLIWTKCILIHPFSFCSFRFDCNRAFITSYILCLLLYFVTFALHHYVYRSLSLFLSISNSISLSVWSFTYSSSHSLSPFLQFICSVFYIMAVSILSVDIHIFSFVVHYFSLPVELTLIFFV